MRQHPISSQQSNVFRGETKTNQTVQIRRLIKIFFNLLFKSAFINLLCFNSMAKGQQCTYYLSIHIISSMYDFAPSLTIRLLTLALYVHVYPD